MATDPLALRPRDLLPYPETGLARTRVVAADLLVLVWCVLAWRAADAVREAILGLQAAGRSAEDAGSSIAGRLTDAGDAVDGVPFAGDPLAAPLRSAAGAGNQLADAGRTAQEAVATTAGVARGVVLGLLVVAVALWWLVRRARWTASVVSARRMRGTGEGLQVLGLRAAARAPLGDVRAVLREHGRPDGGDRLDGTTLEALGRLELRRLGLRAP